MSPSLTTFLFEATNFLVLAGVLGWLFFQPIRAALEDRKSPLLNQSREATEKLAEAERLRAEQQDRESAFQRDLDRLRLEAKAAAEREAEKIRADARAASERERDRLHRELASLQESQIDDLAEEVAAASAVLVRTLLDRLSNTDLDSALIRAACHELQALASHPLAPVVIEAARPLTSLEREAVFNALGEAAQSADVRVTSSLGSGIRVCTARGLIDASCAGISAYARRVVVEQIEKRNGHVPALHTTPAPAESDQPVSLSGPDQP